MYNRRYTMDDGMPSKALSSGRPIRDVASCTGVNRQTVFKWGRMMSRLRGCGPMDTKTRCCSKARNVYRQRLDYQDRGHGVRHGENGATHEQIAEMPGCHRTTVSREPASSDGDWAIRAWRKRSSASSTQAEGAQARPQRTPTPWRHRGPLRYTGLQSRYLTRSGRTFLKTRR